MFAGRVGIGRYIAENLAASTPQMVGMLAGGLAGAAVGGPPGAFVGATAVGTPMFSASNAARAVAEQGSLDQAGAERALATAPAQAGLDTLVGRYLPGAGKVLGKAASTATGGFIRRTAVSMGEAGLTEAATEV